jgi:uncharacterized protein (TIGR02145 family)
MSLGFFNVTSWHTNRPEKYIKDDLSIGKLGFYILNTNRMVDLVALDGNHVQLKYNQSPDNRRGSSDTLILVQTIAGIRTIHDTDYPTKLMTLPIFPTNDITRIGIDTPVFTQIEGDDIAIIYATPKDYLHGVCHMVYYRNTYERVTCIINLSLIDVYSLVTYPLLDYDGNVYYTVYIGTQEWICSGLKTTHYSNGTPIPHITDGADWMADVDGAYCILENDPTRKPAYGALYNWHAVDNANGLAYFTRAGVAEAGWRVPTVADWTTLSAFLGGDAVAGGKLKEKGLAYWAAPNTGATDIYGWSAVGAGNRYVDSDDGEGWYSEYIFNDIWSADEVPAPGDDEAYEAYSVYIYNGNILFSPWEHEKFGGMTVRCVRDNVP